MISCLQKFKACYAPYIEVARPEFQQQHFDQIIKIIRVLMEKFETDKPVLDQFTCLKHFNVYLEGILKLVAQRLGEFWESQVYTTAIDSGTLK